MSIPKVMVLLTPRLNFPPRHVKQIMAIDQMSTPVDGQTTMRSPLGGMTAASTLDRIMKAVKGRAKRRVNDRATDGEGTPQV